MAELITIEQARERVLAAVADPLGSEQVSLEAAVGRTLGAALSSEISVPGFDNSAMDGYAVRVADLLPGGSTELRVIGESRAGAPAGAAIEAGAAIAISTGAMVPDGADAVVRVEDTERSGGSVRVLAAPPAGANVRRAGEDIRAGDIILKPGVLIRAAELGVAAAVGAAELRCVRRPRVAVVATGDELRSPGESLGPGEIHNSNSYAVPALARALGAEVTTTTKVADDEGATRQAIEAALGADVTVICGGVSVGEHDHVRPALAALGVEQSFWGVALRPGKPTWFGRHPGGLVFGLPGNPVSAMVTFILFVRPALQALLGSDPSPRRVGAVLTADYAKTKGRTHAARVRLELSDTGWLATPMPAQGSHVLTSMLDADGLAIMPADAELLAAGQRVTVELLDRA